MTCLFKRKWKYSKRPRYAFAAHSSHLLLFFFLRFFVVLWAVVVMLIAIDRRTLAVYRHDSTNNFKLYRRQTSDGWNRNEEKNTHKHSVTEEETHSDLMYDITYINISSLLIWIIFISCDLWLCNLRATRERERENSVSHCSGYFFLFVVVVLLLLLC